MNRVAQGYCKSSIYYHVFVKQTPAKIVSTFKKFSSKAVVTSSRFLGYGNIINRILIKFELIFYIKNIIVNVITVAYLWDNRS